MTDMAEGAVEGTCGARFEPVRAALTAQLASGEELGASIVVNLNGETVVDIWGGFRDEARTTPWTRDTITNVWSTTKTVTNLAALMLADRGQLDVHTPVAPYWPEFAASGNPNTAYPLIVNETGFDSLFTVLDTGSIVYTGGHNKNLDHAVYINGVKVHGPEQKHYGIGAIDVQIGDPNYGHAILSFNNSLTTGRGAGWAASVSTGAGIYIGGDAQVVGSDTSIARLAYFPASA